MVAAVMMVTDEWVVPLILEVRIMATIVATMMMVVTTMMMAVVLCQPLPHLVLVAKMLTAIMVGVVVWTVLDTRMLGKRTIVVALRVLPPKYPALFVMLENFPTLSELIFAFRVMLAHTRTKVGHTLTKW